MAREQYKIINEFGTPIVYSTKREFEAMKALFDRKGLKYTTEEINLNNTKTSDKVLIYTFPTPGITCGFGRPLVSLKGFEKIENKESKRFHELMNEIKFECLKLEVHFKAEIFETSDIKPQIN